MEDACERATYPGLDRNAKQRGLQELLRLLRVDFTPYEKARAFDYMTTEELREASEAGFNIARAGCRGSAASPVPASSIASTRTRPGF